MSVKTLEDAINAAGNPVDMLRNSQAGPNVYPGVPAEYTNWRDEQEAWQNTCVLYNQSYHMAELAVEGPDALGLLRYLGINSFENFTVDKAKQFVPCTPDGYVIGDVILFYLAKERFNLVGRAPTLNWLQYHAETGDYDVTLELDQRTALRKDPQIPRSARAANHDARKAPRPAIFQRYDADIDVALFEDAVAGEQALDVVTDFREMIAESHYVLDQLQRQILMHPARPEIGRVHARARSALIEHHELFTFLEAPQRRRERAHVHGLRCDVQKMREQPPDLGIEHADQLRASRHGETEELLNREAEGVLLIHRRDIIEPVEIRDRLQIGFVLDQFLGPAMQKTDMRVDARHDLTVELEHEAQHAVRRRMLRSEIDLEAARGVFVHARAPAITARAFSVTRSLNFA
jgi:hypothetical protein